MATAGKTKSLPETSKRRQKSQFDPRWLILFLLIAVSLVVAISVNKVHIHDNKSNSVDVLDVDNSDVDINWDRYQTVDIELKESLRITKSGTYHLTGNLASGGIVVEAGVGEVRLILDNATINNPTGPAILCRSADEFVIEITGSSILSDGANYSDDYDEDIKGTIYSKADLTFQGNGNLTINGNHEDGIIGKDDLKFASGTYKINSVDDGILGKDSVYITGGQFIVESTANAIKSTNQDTPSKGFILIEDGSFNLKTMSKGLKAESSIIISGGKFTINAYDDALHTGNYLGIIDGDFNISSGDDALHADQKIEIDGGKLNVARSHEGIESPSVTINDGDIYLIASDDGVNAGGRTNESGETSTDSDCVLIINGGSIYINASGDGLDSNGWIYFNGGHIVIDGPTTDGNGALDATMGVVTNGGEIIALSSDEATASLGQTSLIHNVNIQFDIIQPPNTRIAIKDSEDFTILEHTSAKSFKQITAGTSGFLPRKTYTLYINDAPYQSFDISSTTTDVKINDTNLEYDENANVEQ